MHAHCSEVPHLQENTPRGVLGGWAFSYGRGTPVQGTLSYSLYDHYHMNMALDAPTSEDDFKRLGVWTVCGAGPCRAVQGHLAHEKQHPPERHHRALGIVLLLGPWVSRFLMSEVPLSSAVNPLASSDADVRIKRCATVLMHAHCTGVPHLQENTHP